MFFRKESFVVGTKIASNDEIFMRLLVTMGWNVFPVITIKKAQNNRRTSEKYKQEDITSYYVLGLLPEK